MNLLEVTVHSCLSIYYCPLHHGLCIFLYNKIFFYLYEFALEHFQVKKKKDFVIKSKIQYLVYQ